MLSDPRLDPSRVEFSIKGFMMRIINSKTVEDPYFTPSDYINFIIENSYAIMREYFKFYPNVNFEAINFYLQNYRLNQSQLDKAHHNYQWAISGNIHWREEDIRAINFNWKPINFISNPNLSLEFISTFISLDDFESKSYIIRYRTFDEIRARNIRTRNVGHIILHNVNIKTYSREIIREALQLINADEKSIKLTVLPAYFEFQMVLDFPDIKWNDKMAIVLHKKYTKEKMAWFFTNTKGIPFIDYHKITWQTILDFPDYPWDYGAIFACVKDAPLDICIQKINTKELLTLHKNMSYQYVNILKNSDNKFSQEFDFRNFHQELYLRNEIKIFTQYISSDECKRHLHEISEKNKRKIVADSLGSKYYEPTMREIADYYILPRRAISVIMAAWRECISNPAYKMCQKRLMREFTELTR